MSSLYIAMALSAASTAAGTASPPPPAPPAVDFGSLPASASIRPENADGKKHQVHARLLADRQQVEAGQTFRLGVHLEQDPGWHTYWKSPGDVGQPTDIEWGLPTGWAAAEYEYPVPQRFELEGLVSYGYDGQVLLFSTVTVPESAPPGPSTLQADVRWLVCERMCIPGEVQLELPIDVVDSGQEPSEFAPLFDHFGKQHPMPADDAPLQVSAELSTEKIQPNTPFQATFRIASTGALSAELDPWPTFTPITGFDWMINDTQIERTADGALQVQISAESFEPDPLPTDDRVEGLVQVEVDGRAVRTEVYLPLPWASGTGTPAEPVAAAVPAVASPSPPVVGGSDPMGTGLMLVMAFLGGLILNVMPCVLPVITLKLYGLVEQQGISAKARQSAGLAYTAGIVASFLALAVAVIGLKATIGDIGWGFQFQYPPYVAALAAIVFAFGLSLFGVFEVPAFGANQAYQASDKEGAAGYFLTGVFATLLATPCSAPFLGTALGFAFSQSAAFIALSFVAIGFGLAAPFLLIAFVPALYGLLPRPGAWMETFKHLMGFTLIATTVWLVDVLAAQVGPERAVGFLAFLTCVGLGAWVFGHWGNIAKPRAHQLGALVAAIGITGIGGSVFLDLQVEPDPVCDSGEVVVDTDLDFGEEIPWIAFTESTVEASSGRPVFIDFTADWCLTCKVNEKTVLASAEVRAAMDELDVVPLKADWTKRDPTISAWLERFGRAGVPFYVVIPADPTESPIALGEMVTVASVIQALKKAS